MGLTAPIVAALLAAAAAAGPYTLQLSLDDGATWRDRAAFAVVDGGRAVVVAGEDAEAAAAGAPVEFGWTSDDLTALSAKASASPPGTLSVRVVEAASSAVAAAMTISACALVTPKQYATPLRVITERYALLLSGEAVAGLRHAVAFSDAVCGRSVFDVAAPPKARLALSVLAPMAVQAAAPAGGAAPAARASAAADGEAAPAAGQASPDGEEKPKEDNRSFLERYWIYIVGFIVYSLVSSMFAPKQAAKPGAADGAESGQGAAQRRPAPGGSGAPRKK